MIQANARQIGELRLVSLDDGEFRLDGGSMFGIVPRTLWAEVSPPDSLNRIALRARPLLVQGPFGNLLIEAGLGDAGGEGFRERYGVATPRGLEGALARAGVPPEGIDHVVMTHLHWDHAGGLVRRRGDGGLEPAFPRAVHHVQGRTWEAALRPGPRAGSYHPDRLEPLARAVRLERLAGQTEVLPGVTLRPAGGHCEDHCVVLLRSGDETAVFLGDLVPLASHFRPLWVMAYDLEPARTVADKESLAAAAEAGGWLAVLYHDPVHVFGRLRRDARGRLELGPA
ncbi:MAG: MBL fold metallo-hydrolase [Planctomycetes bacterium]|nr:MBL fold metallo-hydrolase [Planctomycetota bacterium]